MAFSSIFVPNFLLQAVLRAEPGLRERAVVLTDGGPLSCNVIAANEEAIGQGIRLGMPHRNGTHVEGLEFRSRSQLLEETAHAALLDIGWSVSPRIEDTAPDTIILDLSGLTYLFPSEKAAAEHLASRAMECGLSSQIGVAANADAAWIASRGFCGVTVIESGKESEILGRLPVGVLSPSEETAETWDRWGIRTCADLARLPVLELSERFGQEGVRLHTLARGAGSRALFIAEPKYSFTETMELDDAVEELDPLSFLLGRLLDQLCVRLTSRSLAASILYVFFELEPSPEKSFDPQKEPFRKNSTAIIFKTEIRFPIPIRNSKTLLKLLRLHLQVKPPSAPIRKISLTVESSRPRSLQGELFLPCFPDPEKLELTIARIANLVGQNNVGSPSLHDTHRPDTFHMNHFHTLQNAGEPQADSAIATDVNHTSRLCKSFRIFRPAISAIMEMRAGRPSSIIFNGKRGEVLSASGPWRTSGEWWEENPWNRDEWDVELHFPSSVQDGTYRVYQDRLPQGSLQHSLHRTHWFVQGIYD